MNDRPATPCKYPGKSCKYVQCKYPGAKKLKTDDMDSILVLKAIVGYFLLCETDADREEGGCEENDIEDAFCCGFEQH